MRNQLIATAALVTVGVAGFLFAQTGRPSTDAPSGHRYSAQFIFESLGGGLAITDHVENKHYLYVAKGKTLELKIVTDLTKAGQARLENEKEPSTKPTTAG